MKKDADSDSYQNRHLHKFIYRLFLKSSWSIFPREPILNNPSIQNDVEQIISFLVEWGNKHGIKDLSIEAIEESVKAKAEAIWRQKQAEVQSALEEFVPMIQALDPNYER